MWEIVYFVTNGSVANDLDGRTTPGINLTSLVPVLDPSGAPYRILTPPDPYWRYEREAYSVFLNNKIDKATEEDFENAIKDEAEYSIRSKYSFGQHIHMEKS